MDDRRVGRIFRAVRIRLGLRQRDLSDRTGVSVGQISAAELGSLEHVSLTTLRKLGDALDIQVTVDAWWRSGRVDQLLDRVHAVLVEYLVALLRKAGWDVRAEFTFNEFGDRGSVDVLGWHAASRTLLIGEVKSRIDDVQETVRTAMMKARVVPAVVQRDLGWTPARITRLLVMPDTHGNRAAIRRHAATFATLWPERSVAMRRLIRQPGVPTAPPETPESPGGVILVPLSRLDASARPTTRVRRAARDPPARG
jgi:transcriptional regulator with XRE-family HTH domain